MKDVVAWLRGRIGRRVYVAYTAPYLLTFAGLVRLTPGSPFVFLVPSLAWLLLVAARRLRDLGLSGWWAIVPVSLGGASALIHGFLLALAAIPSPAVGTVVGLIWLGAVLASLVLVFGLAVAKGDPGPNRFAAARSRY